MLCILKTLRFHYIVIRVFINWKLKLSPTFSREMIDNLLLGLLMNIGQKEVASADKPDYLVLCYDVVRYWVPNHVCLIVLVDAHRLVDLDSIACRARCHSYNVLVVRFLDPVHYGTLNYGCPSKAKLVNSAPRASRCGEPTPFADPDVSLICAACSEKYSILPADMAIRQSLRPRRHSD